MTRESRPTTGVLVFNSLLAIALGCGIQAATAPTVMVSCPARTSAAPDCHLHWLIAFDLLAVRNRPLPALQSIDEVEPVRPGSSSAPRRGAMTAFTVYFQSAAGRTRAILWGDQTELRTFRQPIVNYLQDEHAPPLEVALRANETPWRWFASAIIGLGMLQGTLVIAQVLRGSRSSSSSEAISGGELGSERATD